MDPRNGADIFLPMTIKISVYVGTSLDGFIARSNDELDWLPATGEEAGGEDYGYGEFIATVDTIVIGRRTYDKVLTFGRWPYEGKPVVVLTSRPLERTGAVPDSVRSMSGSPEEVAARLESGGARHIYLDGGKTIQQFLDAGLVQRLIVTRIPVLIGSGIPLFGPLHADVHLRHVASRSFPPGLVRDEYEVVPRSA